MDSGSGHDIAALLEHRSFVLQLARSLLRDGNDADDVAQSTWQSAAARGDGAVADPRSWLARITRHHAFNLVRSKTRRTRREARIAIEGAVVHDPASVAERVELAERVVRAVMELDEPFRSTILLHFYDDLPTRAIARAHEVSIDAVRWRLERGLEMLRRAFDAKDSGAARPWRKELAVLVGASAVASSASATASIAAPMLLAAVALVGLTVGVWVARDDATATSVRTEPVGLAAAPVQDAQAANDDALVPMDPTQPTRTALVDANEGGATAAHGEVVLRIGDGYSFGEPAVLPATRDGVDLYCLDQREGRVSVRGNLGAAMARSPLSALGLPKSPAEAARLVTAAPREFAAGDLALASECSLESLAVGFVRARTGAVYRVYVAEVFDDADALRRWARIAFEAVPVAADGGVMHLAVVSGQPSEDVRNAILRAIELGQSLPSESFARQMKGDYAVVDALAHDLTLKDKCAIVLESALTGPVHIDASATLVAAGGIGTTGSIELTEYGAIGVLGPMDGTIDVKSYGYVYVGGPLNGTLAINSYATVVLEGDLVGTMKVRSYTDLLLRGRILGTLDTKSSGWCDFWFDGYWARSELEALGKDASQITLHVRSSDLANGKHEEFGGWRNVIVGEAEFDKFPR